MPTQFTGPYLASGESVPVVSICGCYYFPTCSPRVSAMPRAGRVVVEFHQTDQQRWPPSSPAARTPHNITMYHCPTLGIKCSFRSLGPETQGVLILETEVTDEEYRLQLKPLQASTRLSGRREFGRTGIMEGSPGKFTWSQAKSSFRPCYVARRLGVRDRAWARSPGPAWTILALTPLWGLVSNSSPRPTASQPCSCTRGNWAEIGRFHTEFS